MNPTLVEALRGGHVESRHAGAVAVLDADGAVLAALGDIDSPVFPRSAVKVLQALPLLASGAAERLRVLICCQYARRLSAPVHRSQTRASSR